MHTLCGLRVSHWTSSVLSNYWKLPVFFSPNSLHPSSPSLAAVDKAIWLIDDWAAFSDPGVRHAWDLMKKKEKKLILHNGGRSAELGNVGSLVVHTRFRNHLILTWFLGIKWTSDGWITWPLCCRSPLLLLLSPWSNSLAKLPPNPIERWMPHNFETAVKYFSNCLLRVPIEIAF